MDAPDRPGFQRHPRRLCRRMAAALIAGSSHSHGGLGYMRACMCVSAHAHAHAGPNISIYLHMFYPPSPRHLLSCCPFQTQPVPDPLPCLQLKAPISYTKGAVSADDSTNSCHRCRQPLMRRPVSRGRGTGFESSPGSALGRQFLLPPTTMSHRGPRPTTRAAHLARTRAHSRPGAGPSRLRT